MNVNSIWLVLTLSNVSHTTPTNTEFIIMLKDNTAPINITRPKLSKEVTVPKSPRTSLAVKMNESDQLTV